MGRSAVIETPTPQLNDDFIIQPSLLDGLDDEFPDIIHVLTNPKNKTYGCYCFENVHGLACFSSTENALRFAENFDISGLSVKEVTFDEARDIAKNRPSPIVCMMLLDNIKNPKIHYVK